MGITDCRFTISDRAAKLTCFLIPSIHLEWYQLHYHSTAGQEALVGPKQQASAGCPFWNVMNSRLGGIISASSLAPFGNDAVLLKKAKTGRHFLINTQHKKSVGDRCRYGSLHREWSHH